MTSVDHQIDRRGDTDHHQTGEQRQMGQARNRSPTGRRPGRRWRPNEWSQGYANGLPANSVMWGDNARGREIVACQTPSPWPTPPRRPMPSRNPSHLNWAESRFRQGLGGSPPNLGRDGRAETTRRRTIPTDGPSACAGGRRGDLPSKWPARPAPGRCSHPGRNSGR